MAYLLSYVKIKNESKALTYAKKKRPMVKPNEGFIKILRNFHKKGLFKTLGKGVKLTKSKTKSTTKTNKKNASKKKGAALAASLGLDLSNMGGLGKKHPGSKKSSSSSVPAESSKVEATSVADALSHRASRKSRRRPHRKRFTSS